jgi:hypothetical protein
MMRKKDALGFTRADYRRMRSEARRTRKPDFVAELKEVGSKVIFGTLCLLGVLAIEAVVAKNVSWIIDFISSLFR